MRARSIAAAAALTPMLWAVPAFAACASATRCLCQSQEAIAELTVVATDGPRSTVQVDAVHGTTAALAVGDERVLPRLPEDEPGRPLLMFLWGADGWRIETLEADGRFNCRNAEPDLLLSRQEAIEIALRPDCDVALRERGLQQPPCNDTGYGCAAAPGGLAGLAALWALARAARRRRWSPRPSR